MAYIYDIKTGMIQCPYCKKELNGEIVITYKIDSDYAEEHYLLHKKCVRALNASKRGLTHECPKCKGETVFRREKTDCDDDCVTMMFSRDCGHRPYVVETKCRFCDGEGYLKNAPIPVITDWRKAP